MNKIDLLNAIDAFADSKKVASHVLRTLAEDHLRSFLDKLPDVIQEIKKGEEKKACIIGD